MLNIKMDLKILVKFSGFNWLRIPFNGGRDEFFRSR
jgi:hypothetical protein